MARQGQVRAGLEAFELARLAREEGDWARLAFGDGGDERLSARIGRLDGETHAPTWQLDENEAGAAGRNSAENATVAGKT